MAAVAAMAFASFLAPQQFSGFHRSFSISPSPSSSPNTLFSESAQSQTRLLSSRRAPRGVVAMAGAGKFFVGGNWNCNNTKKSSSTLVSNLNDAILENDAGIYGGFSSSLKRNEQASHCSASRYDAVIEAKKGNPPVMPAVMTPAGPLDLSSVLFRNRIIFIGQPINSQVAQRVISQLVTLATIDEDADILMYLNCPGGSTYSVLAIYDCMSWIKPKVGTVCFGVAASQGALLLAGGEKGMRYAMPNARVMIHQPQSGCGGHVEDVRRQVNEAVQTRHKVDKMYAAFTGQPLEKVQQYTERDRFLSSAEALEFGLIDGLLETEY